MVRHTPSPSVEFEERKTTDYVCPGTQESNHGSQHSSTSKTPTNISAWQYKLQSAEYTAAVPCQTILSVSNIASTYHLAI